MNAPLIVGHRGNTMRILKRYIRDRVDVVEVDVRYSGGRFLTIHGPSPIRRPSLQGRVMAWLDYRFFYRDPLLKPLSLSEVANTINGKSDLMIDVKQRGISGKLVRFLEKLDFRGRVYVTSEIHPEIRDVKRMNPGLITIASVNIYPVDIVDVVTKANADMASIHLSILDGKLIDKLHKNGLKVAVWTVNDQRIAEKFVRMGVDAIVTDAPRVIFGALKTLNRDS